MPFDQKEDFWSWYLEYVSPHWLYHTQVLDNKFKRIGHEDFVFLIELFVSRMGMQSYKSKLSRLYLNWELIIRQKVYSVVYKMFGNIYLMIIILKYFSLRILYG